MFSREHTYTVRRTDEEAVSPEETLAENLSGHSAIELPINKNVVRILYAIVALVVVVFALQAFRLQVVRGAHFVALADQSRFNRYAVPALRGVITDRNGVPIANNSPVFDLVAVQNQLDADRLVALGDAGILQSVEKNKDHGVFVVRKDIPKEEAIRLQAADIPGLYVVAYARRQYEYGPAFAHVLGYTSQVTREELDKNPSLHLRERIGRLGLEAFYDTAIRGESYEVILDPQSIHEQSPVAGTRLRTSLDLQVQRQLYKSLDQVFRLAGVQRGAAVVQDVRTGEILGMVSMPSFDPNLFENTGDAESVEALPKILVDRNKPLFNRTISGLYAPGSTIKPLYALAGLREKNVTPDTMVFADGGIQVQSENDPLRVYEYRDWKVHGWTDLRKAIAWSVDVYFYALGGGYEEIRGLGIDKIEKYLKLFRADRLTGIDLPSEAKGFVPSREWKKSTRNDAWYTGDTYNVSIGQGDLLATPIWLNMYISAIANGGHLLKPRLAVGEVEELGTLPFDAASMQVVREGMRQTITDGTGQMLKDLPRPVAAKTGTAQVGDHALNSLFVVYGPYDNPEISMTVLVEGITDTQGLAMQVANNFLSWYFTQQ